MTATALSGPNPPTTDTKDLVDVVTITRAEYSGGTLTVEAASSDEVTPLPRLTTVNGAILTPTGTGAVQSATISVTIPPATVTVTSDKGGTDTEQVDVVNP